MIGPQLRLHARHVQLDVAEDRREDVVEIVCHTSGQLPNRLHLLRLPELGLQMPPFCLGLPTLGDIPVNRHYPGFSADRNQTKG